MLSIDNDGVKNSRELNQSGLRSCAFVMKLLLLTDLLEAIVNFLSLHPYANVSHMTLSVDIAFVTFVCPYFHVFLIAGLSSPLFSYYIIYLREFDTFFLSYGQP